MIIPKGLLSSGVIDTGNAINESLMFDKASSSYVRQETPVTTDNRKKFTASFWVKRHIPGSTDPLLAGYYNTSNYQALYFNVNDKLVLYHVSSAAVVTSITTDALFRDPTAWYHVVINYDSAQAVQADRFTIWVNGVEQAYTASTGISLNQNAYLNSGDGTANYKQTLGQGYIGASHYSDMTMAECYLLDNINATADDFGYFNSIGLWVPKAYSGSYGTGGWHVDFSDNSTVAALGTDYSGNGNTFDTVSGIGTDHQFTDTPTNDICTLAQVGMAGSMTGPEEGALRVAVTNKGSIPGTYGLTSGKWYFEAKSDVGSINKMAVGAIAGAHGIESAASNKFSNAPGGIAYVSDGTILKEGTSSAFGTTWTTNDVIGIAINVDDQEISFYKNGVQQGTTQDCSAIWDNALHVVPAIGSESNNSYEMLANFGQRAFAYTPPAGFVAISAANLPDPTILEPGDYNDPVIYTGNGTNQDITSLAFQPDLVWIKNRSTANNHALFDAVRGVGSGAMLNPDAVNTEGTVSTYGYVDALLTNGFGVTKGSQATDCVNLSGDNYVAWCLKEGVVPGLDIVSYTGNATNRTIAHSLGVAPDLLIVKNRDAANPWAVWANAFAGTHYMRLDSTLIATAAATIWNDTAPDASVFSVGTSATTNANTQGLIAYLFASVPGFSLIDSYVGNGSTDGPFVHCGFRPAFLILKNTTGAYSWGMYDDAREPYNTNDTYLLGDLPNVETTAGTIAIDFLASGFKVRSSGNIQNQSGATIQFIAFARNPFKYSRAA